MQKAADELVRTQRETFAPLTDAFRNDCALVDKQLDLTVGALNQSVQNLSAEALSDFEARVRKSVYDKIGSGIGNDDLKSVLQGAIEREQKALEAGLSDK
ncbi:hypothetical protein, partial [Trinickia sp.]|uniref:hypothetical protein n=1 Tax=Trinickia sp. TaxID=2571163 RepID=UPI003F80EA13